MKTIVTGASGLVGSTLSARLREAGHVVHALARGQDWDISAGTIDKQVLEGADAVVHLAGENIAAGRWTAAQKARIRDSRVNGTRLLCDALASLEAKPRVLVAASAVGFYGDRGDEMLDESSAPGDNFLAKTCVEWENAAAPAVDAGIRVVHLRLGVVLDPKGGALKKMLLPFKLGGGGVIGNGRQYMPWISLPELVAVIQFAIDTESLVGPVNASTPEPITNHQYTKALGAALGRPTIFPMPAFAARLAFGQMADELLLASARVVPRKLDEASYEFQEPDIKSGLRRMLGK